MLDEHLGYVADCIRLDQFRTAITKAISSGNHVADLGCGSGVLGLLCLQAGAGQVYAIDSTTMLEVARATFSRAGWSERTTFIQGHSHRVVPPGRVDLVICDHVGYFGFDYGIVHTLQDARRRFLKPGGVLIPARIKLELAAVESEKCRKLVEGWVTDKIPPEFHWLRQYTANTKHAVDLGLEEVLSEPVALGEIDLYAENPEFFSWSATLQIKRNGTMHGLAGWFECELTKDVWMTNSPLADRAIQRPQAFLPIDESIQVRAGEFVKVRVMARPADHLLAWVVEFSASGKRFSHSTWQGMLLAPEDLARFDPTRVPHLSHEGQARTAILACCDGQRTIREIEQIVLNEYPNLFPTPEEISRFVAQVIARDTG